MAHYLVTGGAGFIGSHLVEALLARGDRVRVLDNLSTGTRDNVPSTCELRVGDIRDFTAVAEAMAGVDGCFHLAAAASVELSNRDWLGTHAVNLTGTIHLFEAARRRGMEGRGAVPVVYASSAAVYGDAPHGPLRETETPHPLTAYGADKLGCELHARVAGRVHGVPTLGCRFFNVHGPRQDPASPYSGVISIFMKRAREGRELRIFGDGQQVRDFVYVGDVVAHLLRGMERVNPRGEAINVCTGVPTTILQLAQTILDLWGGRSEIAFLPPREGDIRLSLGDPGRSREVLGLEAKTTLVEGLAILKKNYEVPGV
ncbi:MAG: NAD-dependent epimerase/dehydratase family protein [Magnetococcales bacterium]|nr:NAD-dependent epimerase/dehydratase family protein [Magnetococcales bacterium]